MPIAIVYCYCLLLLTIPIAYCHSLLLVPMAIAYCYLQPVPSFQNLHRSGPGPVPIFKGKALHCDCHNGMDRVWMWTMAMATTTTPATHIYTATYFTDVQILPTPYWFAKVVV